ncbi:unnamed protein product, partial [Owenia fusiformis]
NIRFPILCTGTYDSPYCVLEHIFPILCTRTYTAHSVKAKIVPCREFMNTGLDLVLLKIMSKIEKCSLFTEVFHQICFLVFIFPVLRHVETTQPPKHLTRV